MIAQVVIRNGGADVTAPAGWTLRETTADGIPCLVEGRVYERIADGTGSDNFPSVSWTGSLRACVLITEWAFSGSFAYEDSSDLNSGDTANTHTSLSTDTATAVTATGSALVFFNNYNWNDVDNDLTLTNATLYWSRLSGNVSRPGAAIGYFDYTTAGAKSDLWSWVSGSNGQAGILLYSVAGGPPVKTEEMYTKQGGIFVKSTPHVKVGGVWQEADAYVKSGGVWVQVHEK
jgi:hypothetical protein